MRKKKLEKTHAKKKKKKQSHAEDNIYVVRQFVYVHGVTGISLLSRKKIQSAAIQFFYSKTTTTNPNHKNCVFYILCTRFTMGYKTGQKNYPGDIASKPPRGFSMSDIAWAYRPKPPLHELSLKKSSIKNHTTLFGSSTGLNITRLHKTQQITHLETSSITNINRNRPKNNPSSLQLILLSTS